MPSSNETGRLFLKALYNYDQNYILAFLITWYTDMAYKVTKCILKHVVLYNS